jgi:hypothetical protein
VIKLSVEPKVKPKLSVFNLDESRYKKNRDPELPDYTYYTDEENGISVTVNTTEGVVISISYWPTSRENHLRCSGSSENLEAFGFRPFKFAEYSYISRASERRRLSGFAGLLKRFPSSQGYIVTHVGPGAGVREAQTSAKRAINYLVNNHAINAARLRTVEGGHRETWTIELYIVPPGVAPPQETLSVPQAK